MAIVPLGGAIGSTSANAATTAAFDTTGANLIVIKVAYAGNGSTVLTVTDNKGNPAPTGRTRRIGVNYGVQTFDLVPTTVGTGHTFTVSGTGTYPAIEVEAFSGADPTPFIAETGTGGNPGAGDSGVSIQTGSLTPPVDGCLLVAGVGVSNASSGLAIDSGFTLRANPSDGVNNILGGIAWLVQGTRAPVNATWTWTTSQPSGADLIAYRPAAGVTPTLTVSPPGPLTVADGGTASITATWSNLTGAVTSSVSGGGSMPTPTVSGTPVVYTAPSTGSGSATITIQSASDSIVRTITVNYAPVAAVSYSAPPLNPYRRSASPFDATGQCYLVASKGKGTPRNVYHNTIGRPFSGVNGYAVGEMPPWVPNSFAFAPPATGSGSVAAGGWSLRSAGHGRALAYVGGGCNSATKRTTTGNAWTFWSVFTFTGIANNYGSTFPILGSGGSVQGSSVWYNSGQPTSHTPTINGLAICRDYKNAAGGSGYYLAFTESATFPARGYYSTDCRVLPGNTYLMAASFSDTAGTGTGGGSRNLARRLQLHNLTTNARLSTAGAQSFNWDGGSAIATGYTPITPSPGDDFIVFPGGGSFGDIDSPLGFLHAAGLDNQFWDTAGAKYYDIPTAFAGVTPFDAMLANIYDPISATYPTGSTAPTLIETTGDHVVSYAGQAKNQGYDSGAAGKAFAFFGDAVLSRATDLKLQVTVSPPLAAPADPTTYTLHADASDLPVEDPNSSPTVATGTASTTSVGTVLEFTPSSGKHHAMVVTATDGTRTYTYPTVFASLDPIAAVTVAWMTDSYTTNSGHNPVVSTARYLASRGIAASTISAGFDGAALFDWVPGAAARPSYLFPTLAPIDYLLKLIHDDKLVTGRNAYVVVKLTENDTLTPVATNMGRYQSIIAALLASGDVAGIGIVPCSPRPLAGRNDVAACIANNNAMAAQLVNGSTVKMVGVTVAHNASNAWDQESGHPDEAEGIGMGLAIGSGLVDQFISPPTGGGGVSVTSIFQSPIFVGRVS